MAGSIVKSKLEGVVSEKPMLKTINELGVLGASSSKACATRKGNRLLGDMGGPCIPTGGKGLSLSPPIRIIVKNGALSLFHIWKSTVKPAMLGL